MNISLLKKMFVTKFTDLQSVFTSNPNDILFLNHIFTVNYKFKFDDTKTAVLVFNVFNLSYGIYDECKLSINLSKSACSVVQSNNCKSFEIYYSYDSLSGDLKIYVKHKNKDMSVRFVLDYGDTIYIKEQTLGNNFNIPITTNHIKATVNGYSNEIVYTPTLVNGWSYNDQNELVYVSKFGNLVNLNLRISGGPTGILTSEQQLVTLLGNEFKPQKNIYIYGYYKDSSNQVKLVDGRIYSNGELKVFTSTNGNTLSINTTYKI